MKKKIVVFFGPPGSGKGTQAYKLAQSYNLFHISTGEELRKLAEENTELGTYIRTTLAQGDLVPDEMMVDIFNGVIEKNQHYNGFIFDGFPRTLVQTESFDKFLSEKFPDVVPLYIEFDVPESECINRLIKRAVGEGRLDDKDPNVIRHRLNVFNQKIFPVLEYYRENSNYHIVVGVDKDPSEIFNQVKEIFVGCVVHESTS